MLLDCLPGGGRVVLVSGPAGSGKTTLLDECAGVAAGAGFRVLRARSSDGGAFGVARELLGPRAGPPAGADPFEALHGLHRQVVALAEVRPVALVVDDLHLVDAPSLRWLDHLARRLDGAPVAVIAAVREPADSPAPLVTRLRSTPGAHLVRTAPLPVEGVARVLAAALGTPPGAGLAAACHEATGGDPRAVFDVARALADGTAEDPEAAVREVGARVLGDRAVAALRARSDLAAHVARVLAVLDEDPDPALVAEVASVSPAVLARALDALAGLGVLRPGTPRFTHPGVRAAVLADLADGQRTEVHARAARVLCDWGAPSPVVAAHLLAAGPPTEPDMVAALRDAAARAIGRGLHGPALDYLRHALTGRWDPGLRITLLTELSLAERPVDPPSALGNLMAALRMMDSALVRARTAVELFPLFTGSSTADLVDMLEDCLVRLAGETAPDVEELRARLLAHMLCAASEDRGVMERLRPRLDALDHRALGGTPGQSALLAVHVLHTAARGGREVASVVEAATRALRGGLLLHDELLHPMFMAATTALQGAEEFDLVEPLYDAGILRTGARNQRMAQAVLHGARSLLLLRRGDVPGALADARTALDARSPGRWDEVLPVPVAVAVSCLGELGEWDEAADLVRAIAPCDAGRSYRWCWLLMARAEVLEARGDLRGALEQVLACGRALARWGVDGEVYLPWRGRAALLHHRLGEADAAKRLARAAFDLAARWGTDGLVGSALRTLGVVEGDTMLLHDAVAHGEKSPARLELAKTLVELGAAQRGDDDEAARRASRRGLDLAAGCGASALVARARTELVAAGGRPRRDRLHGLDALTPAERQVVALAAQGSGNEEIAQSLFVARRTVEFHLTNSYRKLGLAERSQLIDVVNADDDW
ncbi:ATP-binding protein [Actinokineospora sp. G85]|uniref:ATP-binding protein n=1 Tax=Actinokineospora sp. G85 TaxID=3406626 RepID=UPI003C743DF6